MKTENLISISLYEYLKNNHTGKSGAASSKILEAVFHLNGREIRRIVNILRCEGYPICSDKNGYYCAENKNDITHTVAQLNSRIIKINNAKNGLLCAISANTPKNNPVA